MIGVRAAVVGAAAALVWVSLLARVCEGEGDAGNRSGSESRTGWRWRSAKAAKRMVYPPVYCLCLALDCACALRE